MLTLTRPSMYLAYAAILKYIHYFCLSQDPGQVGLRLNDYTHDLYRDDLYREGRYFVSYAQNLPSSLPFTVKLYQILSYFICFFRRSTSSSLELTVGL